MPRRRLIDPSFNDDIEVSKLTRDERLFLIGCLANADDEGRLLGNQAFLKSKIFMYDDDIDNNAMKKIKESALAKMQQWRTENIWRLEGYTNGGLEYIHFPNWFDFNKPSHPTPSKLPAPLAGASSRRIREEIPKVSGDAPESFPNPPALSQVKSGEGKLSQGRGGQFDFKKLMSNEKDLTDFLTVTLTEYVPRGPNWLTSILSEFWQQTIGVKMSDAVFSLTTDAVKRYPPSLLAVAYAKTAKYGGGRSGSYKYLQKVLEDKAYEMGFSRAKVT